MAADPVEQLPSTARRTFEVGQKISPTLWTRWFQALYETPLMFSGILDDHGRVLDANHLSVEGCGLIRENILGRPFWEGGWWSPDDHLSARVRRWCEQAIATGEPLRTISHYYLAGTVRTVDLALFPVRDDEGDVTYLVATGLDATEAVAAQREREERMTLEAHELRVAAQARAGELKVVRESERLAGERLNRLVSVVLELVGAETVEDLTRVVVDRALPMLGADGGAVAVREEPGLLRLALSHRLGEDVATAYGELPLDSPLAIPYTARTGIRLLLPNRAAGIAFAPEMAAMYEATRRDAWALLPLRVPGRLLGSLAVAWRAEREFSDDEISLLEALAAQCAQALDRIAHLRAQRESALAVQRLSETLQRSLLTQPPTSDLLEIAVRYQPAAHEAEVGGDWYDAFMTSSGATMLAVGDVTGHDRNAAAAMGQIRNMLRGLTYDSDDSPAVFLGRLDHAMAGLEIGTLATAVLGRVEMRAGVRGFVWSNAGHPAPLLRQPDGTVEVLDGTKDPLLGLNPGAVRTDRTVPLTEGSVLLLYTDGLVERRDLGLDESSARLARLLCEVGDRHPQQICDALLEAVPAGHADDIALLVLRCGPVPRLPG